MHVCRKRCADNIPSSSSTGCRQHLNAFLGSCVFFWGGGAYISKIQHLLQTRMPILPSYISQEIITMDHKKSKSSKSSKVTGFSSGSSSRVGGGVKSEKHEIYAAAFSSHLLYDLFLEGRGDVPLAPPGSTTCFNPHWR